jgi:hypothetical protein
MSNETNIYPYERNEVAVDSGDGLTFDLYGYSGQTPTVDPTYGVTPIVKVNGVVKATPADYTFYVGTALINCYVTFTADQTGNTVEVTYKWKYACTVEEDLVVFGADKSPNTKNEKDVNGRSMITEGYQRTTDFLMTLGWAYVTRAFWRLIVHLAETKHTTFDISLASEASPLARVTNLYAISFPKYDAIPGAPCVVNVSLEAVKLSGT